MARKPTYKELEQRVRELEKEVIERKGSGEEPVAIEEKCEFGMIDRKKWEWILNIIPDATMIVDDQHSIVVINKAMADGLGITPENAAGKACYELVHGTDEPPEFCPHAKLLSDGQAHHAEIYEKNLNGFFLVTTSPLHEDDGRLLGSMHVARDITELKRTEEQIMRQSKVLDGINKVFRETLASESEKDVAKTCLAVAEELTGSNFGFIGEVNQAGRFDTIALSNPGWKVCAVPNSDAVMMIKDMEIRGMWGSVIESERSLIVNEPASYLERVGTPEGHPILTSFLGVPLKRSDRTFGMIALANKGSGYSTSDQRNIEDISIAFVEALDRKRAQEALRESEEKYRTLFEDSRDAIYVNRGGRYIDVNQSMLDLFGYTREEMIGMKVEETYAYPDERKRSIKEMAIKGAVRDYEIKFKKKDGRKIDCLVTATGIRAADEKMVGYQGIIRDITQRKQAEAELLSSEERYRTTFESTGTATIIAEEDNTISLANTECTKLCGYSKEEIEGKKSWTEFVLKEDLERMKEYHRLRRTAEGGAPRNYEFRFTDRHGNVRDILLTATLIPGTKKTVASLLDITERKLLEAQLQHTQKMEAVGALAGGMAHEFNNLMTAVMSYSSFLLTELGEDNPMRKDVEEIKSAGKRASSLVKQLLAFSRKQVLQPVVLDLNGVITDTEKMLKHLIGEGVELKMALEQDLGQVKADPSQIEQVILNLAVNAKDAMPEGGKLTIETANAEIDEFYVSTHGAELKPGPYAMLAMSDTGMGMDKEIQSQVFEPFFTTKDTGEGTGLGLSTVYGIVRQSGGDIRVYSESEKGTMFKIYLPRLEQDVEVAQEADLQMEGLGGSETVLLVEDNDLVRKVSRRVLEQYGYRVLEAEDADKALMVSEQHQGLIELMVTDVVMPEMNGKELAERLHPLRPEMKVLYMSGYANNAVVRRGVINQDVAFLEKPFTPDVLADKVRQVLDEVEKRKIR